jgi:hypothetical protein
VALPSVFYLDSDLKENNIEQDQPAKLKSIIESEIVSKEGEDKDTNPPRPFVRLRNTSRG